ncbi:DUF3050 domain-containing protein [Flavobacterium sp. NST-5]|uniref:DUF3050 domain-containing protein n=1 Tax=Flavobacterium ichthyis TaxID=2698827 RepID=A0ABW9Z8Z3_9FLAO|nr:DUF3050 domain-containing protein [Flavobacterium ichthyis]NBL64646.1 DUF3050 domain-containing protein [Flavobacterium ichthyis]
MNTETINESIQAHKDILLNHPLYHKIQSISDLHQFLECHVYAVWDFMSLLKALQGKLTSINTPWLPVGNPEIRYLINEIVLAEETDINLEGKRQSHYEMYIDAMKDCGANVTEMDNFLKNVISTQNIFVSIKQSNLPLKIKEFLHFTFTVIEHGKSHEIAAAFTFGREDLIPSMFTEILKNFQNNFPELNLSKLTYYFERHIELDADDHGPMAMKMIAELCGDDLKKWKEVEEVSILALEKRIGLWEAIEQKLTTKAQMV